MSHHIAEAGYQEALGDGAADGHGMTLTEGAGGILDAALDVDLGMARCGRTPLAELLQLVHRVLAGEGEHCVEHGRHVAGVEEKSVAAPPCGIVGVGHQEAAVQHIDKVGAAHGSARVAALGLLDHRCRQHAHVVGGMIHSSEVHIQKVNISVMIICHKGTAKVAAVK